MACHCTGCQKLTASAFSLSIATPADGLRILQAETVLGGMHGPHRQEYCPHCKGLDVHPAPGPRLPGQCPGVAARRPRLVRPLRREVFTREKLPWARTPAPHSFEAQPDLEATGRCSTRSCGKGCGRASPWNSTTFHSRGEQGYDPARAFGRRLRGCRLWVSSSQG
jgi:hypothetical protein